MYLGPNLSFVRHVASEEYSYIQTGKIIRCSSLVYRPRKNKTPALLKTGQVQEWCHKQRQPTLQDRLYSLLYLEMNFRLGKGAPLSND
jgi:hypothetical protein